jgi:hypothetical protein
LIVLFGLAYLVSQLAILVTIDPIRSDLLRLQCFGFSAAETLRIFRAWQESGGWTPIAPTSFSMMSIGSGTRASSPRCSGGSSSDAG